MGEVPEPSDIEALDENHDVEGFECGKPELDDWLHGRALTNQTTGRTRTFVLAEDGKVIAYYGLSPAEAEHAKAPRKIRKNLPPPTIPVILLARLAVDQGHHRKGLGALLLFDAMRRAALGADLIGGRALLVHAKDEEARSFYEHFNFSSSPTAPLHLYLSIAEIKAGLEGT